MKRRSFEPLPALGITLALSASMALGACGDDTATTDDGPPAAPTWQDCRSSDAAFVRKALLALDGRRPRSQAEVDVYVGLLASLAERGTEPVEARRQVAAVMIDEPSFRLRWSDHFMDALRVTRIEVRPVSNGYEKVQAQSCYGPPRAKPVDDGALAAWVRDNFPSATEPPIDDFVLGDLLSSTLQLDDLSPLYAANLFHLVAFPVPGANVAPDVLEQARRQAFATKFEGSYLNRNLECLTCHSSEFSVTDSADPALDRAWPLVGNFETALFGGPTQAAATPLRHMSVLRYEGVADGGGDAPFGWNGTLCGTFKIPRTDDPLGYDTVFGSVRSDELDPRRGLRASVWALVPALQRGVRNLADGLDVSDDGSIADADEAFAYLVGATIVEGVWREMVGSDLTIANYFPRSEVQRDVLQTLTDRFVENRFSLKKLLLDIVVHPAFDLDAPGSDCFQEDYALPTIFDPWTTSEEDPALRGNSAADAIHPLSIRPLRRSLHAAMGWDEPDPFPEPEERALQTTLGHFIQDSEPGFQGLDLQARLTWEYLYGRCDGPASEPDYLETLLERGASTPGATVGDVVVALKDRLIGEPFVDDSERPAVEALLGVSLDGAPTVDIEPSLRLVCGAYVSSPQFLLAGVPSEDAAEVPRLVAPEDSFATVCEDVRTRFERQSAPFVVTCDGVARAIQP